MEAVHRAGRQEADANQIMLLEGELGTPLFERGRGRSGGVKLTLAGEVLLQRSERILGELDTARAEIDAVRTVEAGRVALGVTYTITREFIPGLLNTFSQSYPGVSFSIIADNGPKLMDMLLSDSIDAAIGYNVRPRPEITNISEHSFAPMIAVARNHPLTKVKKVSLADCAAYPIALPEESQYSCSVQEMFDRKKLNPRMLLTTNSFEAILNAAALGFVVGMTMGTHAHLYPRTRTSPSCSWTTSTCCQAC